MIYFDQAATTEPYEEVSLKVKETMDKYWQNPSSLYEGGIKAHNLLESARICIAKTINAEPEEIFFTSGSTEVLNWFCRNMLLDPTYTTETEHAAVLRATYNPKFVELDKNKVPIASEIPDGMIAVMAYVNNEIGTILPLKEIVDRNVLLVLDATQAYGHIPIDVKKEKIFMMLTSAHKFHGPRGIGFVYIDKFFHEVLKNWPLLAGGGQERGFRAGTENLPAIAGMAVAAMKSAEDRKEKNRKIAEIRNYLYGEITNNIKCAHLNGTADWRKRWCGNLNFRFDGYRGEEILAWFDANKIAVSTGSACSSKSGNPSHVLTTIGLNEAQANSSIRFTFDETNSLDEAKEVYRVLREGLEVLKR